MILTSLFIISIQLHAIEFKLYKDSKFDSKDTAYDLLNQYASKYEKLASNIKFNIYRNISYNSYDDNNRQQIFEYYFNIFYVKKSAKNVFNNTINTKGILVISKNLDNNEISVAIYKLDVENKLK